MLWISLNLIGWVDDDWMVLVLWFGVALGGLGRLLLGLFARVFLLVGGLVQLLLLLLIAVVILLFQLFPLLLLQGRLLPLLRTIDRVHRAKPEILLRLHQLKLMRSLRLILQHCSLIVSQLALFLC